MLLTCGVGNRCKKGDSCSRSATTHGRVRTHIVTYNNGTDGQRGREVDGEAWMVEGQGSNLKGQRSRVA